MGALTRCKVTVGAVAASGTTAAIPGTDYYFLSTDGVYAGDIAAETGVLAETEETDYADEVLVPIKELIRQSVLFTKVVEVTTSSNKSYRKTLHVSQDKVADFDAGIIGKTWPIGVAAQGKIDSVVSPRRVKSRQ